jgi:hypothetical protein
VANSEDLEVFIIESVAGVVSPQRNVDIFSLEVRIEYELSSSK